MIDLTGGIIMKRLRLGLIILLTLSLTGCIKEYTANEQQSDATAEYFASLLLENDKNYTQDLIAENDLTNATPTEKPEGAADAVTTPKSDTKVEVAQDVTPVPKEYSIAEIIGNTDFVFDYSGFEIADTYPKDSESAYFTLTPNKGNQFLVVSFKITNDSNKKQTLDLSKADIQYLLSIGGDNEYEPLFTLLENDLRYLNITLAKGKSEKVLLVFEIAKDIKISDMSLSISKNDKSGTIKIK
jgi:hypothetical protein